MDLIDHLVKYHPEKESKQKSDVIIQTSNKQFPACFVMKQ